MEIPSRLAEIRKRKGWTQRQLAALAGTTQQHISMIENGRCGIEWKTLEKIFRALGCSLSIQEDAGGLREALEARQHNWERLSELEAAAPAELEPPERVLARIGELADVFIRLHGARREDQPSWEDRAREIRAWRKRLSAAAPAP